MTPYQPDPRPPDPSTAGPTAEPTTTGRAATNAGATGGVEDGRTSVADWTAGYEAGYTAGYWAARTALDDAARELADTLRPSAAFDVAQARQRAAERSTTGWATPAERDAYRARVYASWGLTPPEDQIATTAGRTAHQTTGHDEQAERQPARRPGRQSSRGPGRQSGGSRAADLDRTWWHDHATGSTSSAPSASTTGTGSDSGTDTGGAVAGRW